MQVKVCYPFTTTFKDYPDNVSNALMVYFVGCNHNCVYCQNRNLQEDNLFNEEFVKLVDYKDFEKELESELFRYKTNKLVLSGGDPLFYKNINFTQEILNYATNQHIDVTIYTGYNIKYVKDNCVEGFKYIKCGKYEETKKQPSEKTDDYMQFASSNQKLYDENYKLVSKGGRYKFNSRV